MRVVDDESATQFKSTLRGRRVGSGLLAEEGLGVGDENGVADVADPGLPTRRTALDGFRRTIGAENLRGMNIRSEFE